MTQRMQQLEQMLAKEPNDTFLLYGLAMEFKKANDPARALDYFQRVIDLDGGYCYAYHQKGLIYESIDDLESARNAYRAGIEAARRKGDEHARQEIQGALMMLE